MRSQRARRAKGAGAVAPRRVIIAAQQLPVARLAPAGEPVFPGRHSWTRFRASIATPSTPFASRIAEESIGWELGDRARVHITANHFDARMIGEVGILKNPIGLVLIPQAAKAPVDGMYPGLRHTILSKPRSIAHELLHRVGMGLDARRISQ